MTSDFTIEPAGPDAYDMLVEHYLAVWDSYGVPREHHLPDAANLVRSFIDDAAAESEFGAFLCRVGGDVAGSACCQVRRSPYPEVIRPAHRKIGYIWSVLVRPKFRGRGCASALVEACRDHLAGIGCTTVILHSSTAGLSMYRRLGFEPTHELQLKL